MENKGSKILATVIIIPLIVVICILSVGRAEKSEGMVSFAVFGAAELRNEISIPVSEVDNLEVLYTSKNVKVYSSDADKIVIKEYLLIDHEDAKATVTRGESADGKRTVTVTGGKRQGISIFSIGFGEKIEVYLPKEAVESLCLQTKSGNITASDDFELSVDNVKVAAASGNIKWQNTKAKHMSVETASGNIHCKDIKAEEISMAAASGNIDVEKAQGDMEMETSSGSIHALQVKGHGAFAANSGGIKVEADEITGDMKVKTSSGNIKLLLPKGLSFIFEAQTGSGNIDTDFDDKLSFNKKGNQASGVVGENAEYKIFAKANSGNVKIANK